MSAGTKPQRSAREQLAVFLSQVGAANRRQGATSLDCNAGFGSVYNYCERVITAIASLGHAAIQWPSLARRAEIKEAWGEEGFPGAIGACDGCLMRLVEVPNENGITYYCRKKFYAVRESGLICDFSW